MTAADLATELAQQAVEDGHVGIVAGVVAGDEIAIASAGRTRAGGDESPGERTMFRIASLSKVLTGTALARAAVRGEFALETSVRDALPAWFELPADPFEPIRLDHLATHTSGLPRGLDTDPDGSIQDYARALAQAKATSAPGREYAYSNLGAQLAGMALTQGTDRAFDAVLRSALAGVPGTRDIMEWPDGEQQARVAPGHDEAGEPCVTPTYPLGVASGGLYGSAEALLRFARAHWASADAELVAALRLATTPRAEAAGGHRIGVFWHVGAVEGSDGLPVTWHNGSLPGYRSFLGFVPDQRAGVVVLSNTARPVDELGGRLLARVTRSSPS